MNADLRAAVAAHVPVPGFLRRKRHIDPAAGGGNFGGKAGVPGQGQRRDAARLSKRDVFGHRLLVQHNAARRGMDAHIPGFPGVRLNRAGGGVDFQFLRVFNNGMDIAGCGVQRHLIGCRRQRDAAGCGFSQDG